MAKQYQWRATTRYQGDTPTLSYGVTPTDKSDWQTTDATSGSGTWTYWFRDSNTSYAGQYVDRISSRVAVVVTQSWTANIDNRNYLTIRMNTTISSIVRDDLQGTDQNTPCRDINIYREQGGAAIYTTRDCQIATAHTILGTPLTLDSYTITLAPGESAQRSSLYLHNQTTGATSYDDIWLGVQFRNILPADYRPGASLDTNTNVWKSHNRSNGACHVRTSSAWQECRTVGAPEGLGDLPSVYHDSKWYNQLLLGKE